MTATALPRFDRDSGGPGALLARAVAERAAARSTDEEVSVRIATPLPATFPLAAERPRYTVRHLLQSRTSDASRAPYLSEEMVGSDISGDSYGDSPESRFEPRVRYATTTRITARLGLPREISRNPELLAHAVDRRLVVRICTVENDVFLNGSADGAIPGIRHLPGIRTLRRSTNDLGALVAEICALVEETGGSCDAMVVHPADYWRLVSSGLLGHLVSVGVRVSRTRMIPPGELLFGDFRAALTIIDTDDSEVGLTPGAQDEIWASTRVGLAAPLPQHIVKVVAEGAGA